MDIDQTCCNKSLRDRNDLLLKYKNEVNMWSWRLCRRGFERQDAYSEIVCRVLADMDGFESWDNPRAMIGIKCRSAAYKIIRSRGEDKRGHKVPKEDIDEVDESMLPYYEDSSDCLLNDKILELQSILSGRELDILIRHYYNDHDMKDIAADYGVAAAALTPYHNKLKAKLRELAK